MFPYKESRGFTSPRYIQKKKLTIGDILSVLLFLSAISFAADYPIILCLYKILSFSPFGNLALICSVKKRLSAIYIGFSQTYRRGDRSLH